MIIEWESVEVKNFDCLIYGESQEKLCIAQAPTENLHCIEVNNYYST
jgi:hypothetical protein